MFLPFLYDNEARSIREKNFQFLDETVAGNAPDKFAEQ
jgi:hypothetical protein